MEQHMRAINQKQAIKLLEHIEATQSEDVKKDIFSQLGCECFALGHYKELGIDLNDSIEQIMEFTNVEKNHPSWEELYFNQDGTILYVTGKPVDEAPRCPCSFGRGENPPASLCIHCCGTFQESLWRAVLKKNVRVETPQSRMFGDKRCNHTVFIL